MRLDSCGPGFSPRFFSTLDSKLCKGAYSVDLGESFHMSIDLQKSASTQSALRVQIPQVFFVNAGHWTIPRLAPIHDYVYFETATPATAFLL